MSTIATIEPPEIDELTPPNDLAAEVQVLGACLMSRQAMDAVLEIVIAPDFYRPAHEAIFAACATLHLSGEPVDAVSVTKALDASQSLARVGGQAYLHHLAASLVTSANADYHARTVADTAVRRRLVEAGAGVQQAGYLPTRDVDAAVAHAQQLVDAVAARRLSELRSAAEVVDDALAETRRQDKMLDTPWPELTGYLKGLRAGRVYVIGARPGAGKTVMACNLALWWMQRHRKAVAFSTLEMPRAEIVLRLLANMSGVPFSVIEGGQMSERQQQLVDSAVATLKVLPPLWVDDREAVEPGHVRSHARQAARRSNLGLVVVDYLQLMESGKPGENRNQEVARFSRAIKKMARALDVPVVLLSQLNRGSEQRGQDSPPRLSDLRDSGAVEQDADVALLLHLAEDGGAVAVGVAKNRQGPKGSFRLAFDGALMRMTESPWSPSGSVR